MTEKTDMTLMCVCVCVCPFIYTFACTCTCTFTFSCFLFYSSSFCVSVNLSVCCCVCAGVGQQLQPCSVQGLFSSPPGCEVFLRRNLNAGPVEPNNQLNMHQHLSQLLTHNPFYLNVTHIRFILGCVDTDCIRGRAT